MVLGPVSQTERLYSLIMCVNSNIASASMLFWISLSLKQSSNRRTISVFFLCSSRAIARFASYTQLMARSSTASPPADRSPMSSLEHLDYKVVASVLVSPVEHGPGTGISCNLMKPHWLSV